MSGMYISALVGKKDFQAGRRDLSTVKLLLLLVELPLVSVHFKWVLAINV